MKNKSCKLPVPKKKSTKSANGIKPRPRPRTINTVEQLCLTDENLRRPFRLVTKTTLATLIPDEFDVLQLDGTKKVAKLIIYNYIRRLFELARANNTKNISFHSKQTDNLVDLFNEHEDTKIINKPIIVCN